ncbi:maleylpyruvate isomerase family mycothiol-dependent enzyme [Arthrobacter sp. H5]|uniref:maleylpyruvate isomerase family mycothiol-dependent enzyme n=1 Tax=Arthrobacter sp. H5 TaxID=1267973 RepID=UPI000481A467|nr:maleylpyruvate isomerase family mycothiol-dependent enzyme [Arthrobacter sp. H5]
MTSNPELFRSANGDLITVLAAVGDWSASSTCEDWTVRGVLDHLIDTQRDFLAQHALDIGPRPQTSEDPLSAWTTHSSKVQGLLDTPKVESAPFDGFFGPTTVGATLATFYGFDLVVHRWDIARSIGLDNHFSEGELDLIEVSLDGFGEHLYMEGICKPALPVPDDADRETRLLARMGRDARAALPARYSSYAG